APRSGVTCAGAVPIIRWRSTPTWRRSRWWRGSSTRSRRNKRAARRALPAGRGGGAGHAAERDQIAVERLAIRRASTRLADLAGRFAACRREPCVACQPGLAVGGVVAHVAGGNARAANAPFRHARVRQTHQSAGALALGGQAGFAVQPWGLAGRHA